MKRHNSAAFHLQTETARKDFLSNSVGKTQRWLRKMADDGLRKLSNAAQVLCEEQTPSMRQSASFGDPRGVPSRTVMRSTDQRSRPQANKMSVVRRLVRHKRSQALSPHYSTRESARLMRVSTSSQRRGGSSSQRAAWHYRGSSLTVM